MTYELIAATLESNHFYPSKVVSGNKVTELHVDCPSLILMDDRIKRIEEVLAGSGAKVSAMRNQGYILIKNR